MVIEDGRAIGLPALLGTRKRFQPLGPPAVPVALLTSNKNDGVPAPSTVRSNRWAIKRPSSVSRPLEPETLIKLAPARVTGPRRTLVPKSPSGAPPLRVIGAAPNLVPTTWSKAPLATVTLPAV